MFNIVPLEYLHPITFIFFFSLKDATNTTNKLFKYLKKDRPKKNNINILVAIQELEKFAVNYGKIHYKATESKIFAYEQFGECDIYVDVGQGKPGSQQNTIFALQDGLGGARNIL